MSACGFCGAWQYTATHVPWWTGVGQGGDGYCYQRPWWNGEVQSGVWRGRINELGRNSFEGASGGGNWRPEAWGGQHGPGREHHGDGGETKNARSRSAPHEEADQRGAESDVEKTGKGGKHGNGEKRKPESVEPYLSMVTLDKTKVVIVGLAPTVELMELVPRIRQWLEESRDKKSQRIRIGRRALWRRRRDRRRRILGQLDVARKERIQSGKKSRRSTTVETTEGQGGRELAENGAEQCTETAANELEECVDGRCKEGSGGGTERNGKCSSVQEKSGKFHIVDRGLLPGLLPEQKTGKVGEEQRDDDVGSRARKTKATRVFHAYSITTLMAAWLAWKQCRIFRSSSTEGATGQMGEHGTCHNVAKRVQTWARFAAMTMGNVTRKTMKTGHGTNNGQASASGTDGTRAYEEDGTDHNVVKSVQTAWARFATKMMGNMTKEAMITGHGANSVGARASGTRACNTTKREGTDGKRGRNEKRGTMSHTYAESDIMDVRERGRPSEARDVNNINGVRDGSYEAVNAREPVVRGKANATGARKVTRWANKSVAFKRWVTDAVGKNGVERAELYAFLTECFNEADSDRDGFVNAMEFDLVVENAAALPRSFGLAHGWKALYGDIASRLRGRAKLFRTIDVDNKGTIGIENWSQCAFQHIAVKIQTMS